MFSTSPQFYCKIPWDGDQKLMCQKLPSEMGIDYIWSASGNWMKSHQNRASQFKHLSKTCLFVFVFLVAANMAFCQYPDTVITLNKNSEKHYLKRIPAGFVSKNFNVETGYNANILSREPLKITHVKPQNVSKKLLARFSVVNNTDTPDSLYFFSWSVFWKRYSI